jgi:hypothetical protein
LTRGKHKLGRAIGKGRRGNGLSLHTERQVMGLSYDDYREREGENRTKEKMGERVQKCSV